MDDGSNPGEPCRALPGKEHGAKQLPVLSKPALHCVSKAKTWHTIYHCECLPGCKREREEL